MKVYVVGYEGPEHNSVSSIHRSYKGALKAWNELRLMLLRNAKSLLGGIRVIKLLRTIIII